MSNSQVRTQSSVIALIKDLRIIHFEKIMFDNGTDIQKDCYTLFAASIQNSAEERIMVTASGSQKSATVSGINTDLCLSRDTDKKRRLSFA